MKRTALTLLLVTLLTLLTHGAQEKTPPKPAAPATPTKPAEPEKKSVPIPEGDQVPILKLVNTWQALELQVRQLREQERAAQQQYFAACNAAIEKNSLKAGEYTCDISNVDRMQFVPVPPPHEPRHHPPTPEPPKPVKPVPPAKEPPK